MTVSNDNCSNHLLSDVRYGALVQTKQYEQFYTERIWEDGEEVFALVWLERGEIAMYYDSSATPPASSELCWKWQFSFLHKDHGKIWLYWDMNFDGEVDLCAKFELISRKNS